LTVLGRGKGELNLASQSLFSILFFVGFFSLVFSVIPAPWPMPKKELWHWRQRGVEK
jgi:hypothetical protein